jgi:hypothetical protein
VAGGIISKLPPSWKDFATSLKHSRQDFTIDGLIGSLDVEEKVRAKDTRGKGVVGASANFVQRNNNFVQKNNPTRTRRSHRRHRAKQRLNRQPLSRRRRKETAMCARVWTTSLESVRIVRV